jgi:TetR/AcrR family transcriptional regulator
MVYTPEQRIAKRYKIIKKITALLLKKDYAQISMNELAAKCQIGKGTIYNYFSCKEEIFLELYNLELDQWLKEVDEVFSSKAEVSEILNLLVESHVKRKLFLKLMSLLNTILEEKLPYDLAKEFKFSLLEKLTFLSKRISENFPLLDRDQAGQFLIHYTAHTVGLYFMSKQSQVIKKIFNEHKELAIFNTDLEKELKKFVFHYFFGIKTEIGFIK